MHIKRPFENGRSNSKGLFHIYVRVDMGEGLPHIPKIADFSVKCNNFNSKHLSEFY